MACITSFCASLVVSNGSHTSSPMICTSITRPSSAAGEGVAAAVSEGSAVSVGAGVLVATGAAVAATATVAVTGTGVGVFFAPTQAAASQQAAHAAMRADLGLGISSIIVGRQQSMVFHHTSWPV